MDRQLFTKIKKCFMRFFPAILMMVIIFAMSSIEGETIKSTGLNSPQINVNGHFILYFFLGLSIYHAIKHHTLVILLGMIYALSDEVHQTFVPGRSFQVYDLIIDLIGLTLAQILIWIWTYKTKNKSKNLQKD